MFAIMRYTNRCVYFTLLHKTEELTQLNWTAVGTYKQTDSCLLLSFLLFSTLVYLCFIFDDLTH